MHVAELAFAPLIERVRQVDAEYSPTTARSGEGPLWALVAQRPPHLLDPKFKTWTELFVAAADRVAADAQKAGGIATYTWGRANTVRIRHPLERGRAAARTLARHAYRRAAGRLEHAARAGADVRGVRALCGFAGTRAGRILRYAYRAERSPVIVALPGRKPGMGQRCADSVSSGHDRAHADVAARAGS